MATAKNVQLFYYNYLLTASIVSAQLDIPCFTVIWILHKCIFLKTRQKIDYINQARKEKWLKFEQRCSSCWDKYSDNR